MAVEPVIALISIHPRFAQAILQGEKLVELRRVAFKRIITHVVMYETGTTGAIVGVFKVKRVVEESPTIVWETYNGTSGLTKSEFDAYFKGKAKAVAIEVGKATRFKNPISLQDIQISRPPQSFLYLPSDVSKQFVKIRRSG